MRAASLEVLEKANVPSPQARAIVQAIDFELCAAKDTLATKHDLLELRLDLESRIGSLETKMEGVRAGLMRWVFLVVLSIIPIMTGIMYFLLQNFRR